MYDDSLGWVRISGFSRGLDWIVNLMGWVTWVSLSLSAILFYATIAIAIADTFEANIGIDYRDTFKKYR